MCEYTLDVVLERITFFWTGTELSDGVDNSGDPALVQLARSENFEGLQNVLCHSKISLFVNRCSPKDKSSPLHLAARAGQVEICRLLVENGSTIDLRDDNGLLPFEYGVIHDYEKVVEYFLQKGHNPNTTFLDGRSPLNVAIGMKNFLVLPVLLKYGFDPSHRDPCTGKTSMHLAILSDCEQEKKYKTIQLQQFSAECSSIPDEYGQSSLHEAARLNDTQALQLLSNSTDNPDHIDCYGTTPLHLASRQGNTEAVSNEVQTSSFNPNLVKRLFSWRLEMDTIRSWGDYCNWGRTATNVTSLEKHPCTGQFATVTLRQL